MHVLLGRCLFYKAVACRVPVLALHGQSSTILLIIQCLSRGVDQVRETAS